MYYYLVYLYILARWNCQSVGVISLMYTQKNSVVFFVVFSHGMDIIIPVPHSIDFSSVVYNISRDG